MKKKFRKITVDGEKWSWTFYIKPDDYYGVPIFKIWRDRKLILEKNYFLGKNRRNFKMTPAIVSRFIKVFLKK